MKLSIVTYTPSGDSSVPPTQEYCKGLGILKYWNSHHCANTCIAVLLNPVRYKEVAECCSIGFENNHTLNKLVVICILLYFIHKPRFSTCILCTNTCHLRRDPCVDMAVSDDKHVNQLCLCLKTANDMMTIHHQNSRKHELSDNVTNKNVSVVSMPSLWPSLTSHLNKGTQTPRRKEQRRKRLSI